jgi:hypothetical protein
MLLLWEMGVQEKVEKFMASSYMVFGGKTWNGLRMALCTYFIQQPSLRKCAGHFILDCIHPRNLLQGATQKPVGYFWPGTVAGNICSGVILAL